MGGVEFRLLGDVEVWVDGRLVDVGAARQRSVLVGLLVDAGRAVPVDQLIDRVWGGRPPQRVRPVLYSYVSRLRAALAGGDVRIERRRDGYAMAVDPVAIDVCRFRREVALARAAADDDGALVAYDRALGLWRGEAFGAMDSVWLAAQRAVLAAERHAAELDRTDVALRFDRYGALVSRVTELAAAHPLDERVAGQLMLALHLSGRAGDALAVSRATRRRLSDELGVDPGPELRRIELAILRGEPADDRRADRRQRNDRHPDPLTSGQPGDPQRGEPGTGGRREGRRPGHARDADRRGDHGGPRQLPADVAEFTGRRAEVARVVERAGNGTAVVITAIDGMAGIGKTALAVHVAHRLAPRFPDGQLFLDLHGFTEGRSPIDPEDALDVLLRAVGVSDERVPPTVEERAGLWRSRLAGRNLLVVLDNAATEAQVRPLLPGAPGCVVLVTSRLRLAGLDGAEPVSLDVLPVPDAAALFLRAAGDRGTHAEPGAVREVVELCGRLPLAIGIAAARWRARPSWTLVDLRDRLAGVRERLAELRAGQRCVETAFRLSYLHLAPEHRHLFRRLGNHPGVDVDAPAAAALAGVGAARAGAVLEDLVDAHLLLSLRPGRYQFHDLLRGFAATVAAEEPEQDRAAALARLADHHLRTAAAAVDVCYPYDTAFRPRVTTNADADADDTGAPPDRAAATAWLDAELDNVLAVAEHLTGPDRCGHLHRLGTTLTLHLELRRRHGDAERLHSMVLAEATTAGDRVAMVRALTGLGHAYYRADRRDEAGTVYAAALCLAREVGDRLGELTALGGVGNLHALANRLTEAEEHYRPAIAIARELGHRVGEQRILNGLGYVQNWRGDHVGATGRAAESLAVARAIGDRHGEIVALSRLADIDTWTGYEDRAVERYQQALVAARELGDRAIECSSLAGLAFLNVMAADPAAAIGLYDRALAIARDTGDRRAEAHTRWRLADLHLAEGHADDAEEHYRASLAVARDLGDRRTEIYALRGLGGVAVEDGRCGPAATHFEDALAVARDFGDRGAEVEVLHGYGECLRHTDPARAADVLWCAVRSARDICSAVGELMGLHSLGNLDLAAGRTSDALAHFHAALLVPCRAGGGMGEALTHYHLARAHHAAGDDDLAGHHWREARRLHAGTRAGVRAARIAKESVSGGS